MSKDAPSKEEKEKADHLKRNIEKIMGQRMKQTRDRKKRDAAFALKLKGPQIDEKVRRKMKVEYFLKESQILREQRSTKNKVTANDFEIIKIIGKGAFGEVRIVRDKITKKVFAMKTMIKEMMVAKNQMGHIVAERDLMADADAPWLVKLHYAFQDADYLYLVMEFCGGGDLMGLLIKKDILSESHTRFYMAELAAAINCVHDLGFVHRDLKPDNVLISNDGHIRLSDFGLAKSFQSSNDKQLDNWQQYVQTIKAADLEKMKNEKEEIKNPEKDGKKKRDRKQLYSTVGTPDYIAIEVLYQKGYDKKVDWWSMGVIMFECLVGYAPFHANEPLATCRKIVRYERYFKIPNEMKLSKTSIDLMKSLVTPKHKRLDWGGIQKHDWFKKVSWKNLASLKPPFTPDLKNDADPSNFDEIEEEQSIASKNIQQSSFSSSGLQNKNNRVFGYTFNAKDVELYKNLKQKTEISKQSLNQSKK